MSLYNNVADSMASKGLASTIQGGFKAGLGSVANSAIAAFGGGKVATAVVGAASNVVGSAAASLANKYVPDSLRSKINAGSQVLGHAMSGNWDDAGMAALEGGFFDGLLNTLSGSAAQQAIMGRKSPLLGGGSLSNAKQLVEKVVLGKHVHKNFFLLEVSSLSEGDFSSAFNLFAVDVSYDAFNITGDKKRVGGALVDTVTGQEAVEMRFTTFDDQSGSLKKFWARHHARAVARDGTVGVPADYALKIKVLHGVIEGGGGHSDAYADEGLFRVQTLSTEQSRREDGLQELQMTFSQLDTFMKV